MFAHTDTRAQTCSQVQGDTVVLINRTLVADLFGVGYYAKFANSPNNL
jgi:hypothetical protein